MSEGHVFKQRTIDPSTILGVLIACILVIIAIFMGGNPKSFIDVPSVLIVVLGTFAVTAASFSTREMFRAMGTVIHTIFYKSEDISQSAIRSIELSKIARKEGFLALDNVDELVSHNEFLKAGVRMVVDGMKAEEIDGVLEQEINSMVSRHAKGVSILRKASEVAPAMGMIGTLIGLVQMLSNLSDASTIGPAMSVALLTTFYGAVISYMILSPLASKLERNTRDELLLIRIYHQAIRSICAKENPRQLEVVLNSILPPNKRISYFSSSDKASSEEERK